MGSIKKWGYSWGCSGKYDGDYSYDIDVSLDGDIMFRYNQLD
jgi:hypothetical protein